jgi:hypothetical protein
MCLELEVDLNQPLVSITPEEYRIEIATRLDEITTDDYLKQAFYELLAFSIQVRDLFHETQRQTHRRNTGKSV